MRSYAPRRLNSYGDNSSDYFDFPLDSTVVEANTKAPSRKLVSGDIALLSDSNRRDLRRSRLSRFFNKEATESPVSFPQQTVDNETTNRNTLEGKQQEISDDNDTTLTNTNSRRKPRSKGQKSVLNNTTTMDTSTDFSRQFSDTRNDQLDTTLNRSLRPRNKNISYKY